MHYKNAGQYGNAPMPICRLSDAEGLGCKLASVYIGGWRFKSVYANGSRMAPMGPLSHGKSGAVGIGLTGDSVPKDNIQSIFETNVNIFLFCDWHVQ